VSKVFKFTLPNRKSSFHTVAEEKEAAERLTEEKLKACLQILPGLLKQLERIPDPRDPKKVKHQITVLMLYGILMFVFQIASRRQANRALTTPQLLENLKALYPELNDMPHQDTLHRFLESINVTQIEDAYIDLLRQLMRKKKFRHLLHQGRFLIAIDGTQKHVMNACFDEHYLRRKVGEDKYQYYVYVLEAVLIFSNGMVLPLMSEFLENSPELQALEDDKDWKQDCELKAFYRLAARIKREFPRLPITLLLDGLYANGPVINLCRKNKWQFMIVLKDESLPTVWQEVNGLMRLDTRREHYHERTFRGRKQAFRWVNGIEYEYDSRRKSEMVHVVICDENWVEVDKQGTKTAKDGRYAWISSEPLNCQNIHTYCNLMARKRWLHENNILKEKHQGYNYEHIYSHNWNAMRGYHYLMHIARLLNELAIHSVYLTEHVKEVGIRLFIQDFRATLTYRALDQERLRLLAESPGQLRLVWEDNWKAIAA